MFISIVLSFVCLSWHSWTIAYRCLVFNQQSFTHWLFCVYQWRSLYFVLL